MKAEFYKHPRIARLLTGLLLLLISCSAADKATKTDKHFLWKVSSQSTEIYLLGSIHMGDSSMYPLAEIIEQSYESSEDIAVELNLNNISPAEIMQHSLLPEGETLRQHLDDSTFSHIASVFEDNSIPEFFYNRYKPGFALLTVISLEIMSNSWDNASPALGIDMYFLNKAKNDGKTIHELETLGSQLDIFEKLDKSLYLDILAYNSDGGTGESTDYVRQIADAWKSGDAKTTEKLVVDQPMEEFPKLKDFFYEMYDKRNIHMTNKIEEYLQGDKKIFVIAGTAHFLGKSGIISLLSQTKKYSIEQL